MLVVNPFLTSLDFLPNRQLLSGVENLRLIANNIESMDQPSSSTTNLDYLSDSDDNFTEGPAL
jgi:hypothetical protein